MNKNRLLNIALVLFLSLSMVGVTAGQDMIPAWNTPVGSSPATWVEQVWINGTLHNWNGGPFGVAVNDEVIIIDQVTITSTNPVSYTLTGNWASLLTFEGAEADSGTLIPGTNTLTWQVEDADPASTQTLTKTFSVARGAGWTGNLNETLAVWLAPGGSIHPVTFHIPATLQKDAPATARHDEVIPYTIEIASGETIDALAILTDSLPVGVQFAGNLTATYGTAWYDSIHKDVYWNNASDLAKGTTTGSQPAPAGRLPFRGPVPPNPLTSFSRSVPVINPKPELAATSASVLWDQPASASEFGAFADQDFETTLDALDIFIADDFQNTHPWVLESIFVPGNLYNGGYTQTLMNATSLNWLIYPDQGGKPDGDPYQPGIAYWELSLAPDDPQVTITNGIGGRPSNTRLNLATPAVIPAGRWWLVFYPRMDAATGKQYGRQAADTTNLGDAQVINPGQGFGFPSTWTSVRSPSTWGGYGLTKQDFAFRLEGQEIMPPALITVSFNVRVTAPPGSNVTNTVLLKYEGVTNRAEATTHVIGVDLGVTKIADPTQVIAGRPFTYTITVNNAGPDMATGVVLTDTLPASLLILSKPTYCTRVAYFVFCDLGNIAVGGSKQVVLKVKAPNTQAILTNIADVGGSEDEINPANNHFELNTNLLGLDMEVSKLAKPTQVLINNTLTYTITLVNHGIGTATSVVLTDTLPASVVVVSKPAGCQQVGHTITCALGEVDSGETIRLVIVVKAPNKEGWITNVVDVASYEYDPNHGNNHFSLKTFVWCFKAFLPMVSKY